MATPTPHTHPHPAHLQPHLHACRSSPHCPWSPSCARPSCGPWCWVSPRRRRWRVCTAACRCARAVLLSWVSIIFDSRPGSGALGRHYCPLALWRFAMMRGTAFNPSRSSPTPHPIPTHASPAHPPTYPPHHPLCSSGASSPTWRHRSTWPTTWPPCECAGGAAHCRKGMLAQLLLALGTAARRQKQLPWPSPQPAAAPCCVIIASR